MNVAFDFFHRDVNVALDAHFFFTLTVYSPVVSICISKFNPLALKDTHTHAHTHTHIYIYKSYRTANLQTLHFKYLLNKYTY